MCTNNDIDRLASRHIAKLLTRLGDTIAPVQESEIKRQIRYFADDVKQVNTVQEISEHDEAQYPESNGNI
jgi:hypothetical protein